tara:strand:- start:265 stop:480 length:216 start_codon:yes stop_codon:yes gene_type:complete
MAKKKPSQPILEDYEKKLADSREKSLEARKERRKARALVAKKAAEEARKAMGIKDDARILSLPADEQGEDS